MKAESAQPESFEFVSDTPIVFPPSCVNCGKPTKKFMAVKVTVGRPNFVGGFMQGMFGGHALHLLHGLQALKAGSVRIPCCSVCRTPYYWGNFLALVCLVGGMLGFYFTFSLKFNLPTWALYLTVIPSAVCAILWILPHTIGKAKALRTSVWMEGNRYHYFFLTKALQEVLAASLNSQQTAPPRLAKSKEAI